MRFGSRTGAFWAALLLLLPASMAGASMESELAFNRGVVAYGDGQLEEARRQFEIALAEDPKDPVTLHYLGLVAQGQKDHDAALGYFERALAVTPDDPDLLLDRGIALLDVGRVVDARRDFARVIALAPDNARAQLFAGIAAYRMGEYAAALPYLDRASELDASLRAHSRYYAGLSQALVGNVTEAATSFQAAAAAEPLSPLGQSAQNLSNQMAPRPKVERPWQASLTAGMEVDSNPLIIGDSSSAFPLPGADTDGRGVLRASASYRFLGGDGWSLTAGYDGFVSLYIDETKVNTQTQNPWLAASYDLGPARLGMRVDYAYTWIDTTNPFRQLLRATPSVAFRERNWGVTYLYYQWYGEDYKVLGGNPTFSRTGMQNVGGVTQFFFLPPPFTYVRLGALADFTRTKGTEWEYNGVEASMGAGYDFDYDINLTWLFEYTRRDYLHGSAFSSPPKKRLDDEYDLSVSIGKDITQHWEVSLGGTFTWNDSNVNLYNYNRQVGGAYVTYRF